MSTPVVYGTAYIELKMFNVALHSQPLRAYFHILLVVVCKYMKRMVKD